MNKKVCKKCCRDCGMELSLDGTFDARLPKKIPEKDGYTFQFRCTKQEKIDESKLIGIPVWLRKTTTKKIIHKVDIPKKYNAQILNQQKHDKRIFDVMNFKCFSKVIPEKSCPFYMEHELYDWNKKK